MLQDRTSAIADFESRNTLTDVPAARIVAAMDAATTRLHTHPDQLACDDRVMALHQANFTLWHLEDSARSPSATAEQIADIKRAIDRVNQERNDHAEAVDVELLAALAVTGLPRIDAPLHSETPGQMLDRLSILSLKRFHTREEVDRAGVDESHRERNAARLSILNEQSGDLTKCLQELWSAVLRGERRFKRYRQMKMYNDPELNPVLYMTAARP